MNWFSNRCRARRQSLCLLAGGALSEAERTEIERHLVDCADCRAYQEQIGSVTGSLADFRGTLASLEPTQAARQRWAQAISVAAQPEQAGPGRFKPYLTLWWRELFQPCRHAWGGIAALWFVVWAVNWGHPGIHEAARTNPGATREITRSFDEEQRLLAELLPTAGLEPVESPRRKPQPHSERQRPWVIG